MNLQQTNKQQEKQLSMTSVTMRIAEYTKMVDREKHYDSHKNIIDSLEKDLTDLTENRVNDRKVRSHMSSDRQEIKKLNGENEELKKANEELKKANEDLKKILRKQSLTRWIDIEGITKDSS